MAATNYTPIQLYHSTTASASPAAGNLVNGELAINILDGKLYYKDNGGAVQVIASKGTGTIGGSTTQVQYNNAGALAGSANFTFNGTTATINTLNLTNALGAAYGGTAQSTYAQGDLLYASAANTLAKLPIGISTYILTSNGSIPGWSIPSSVVIGTATNLAGGAAGSVPYQSGASTTAFLSIGTVNQVITSTGSAPQWSSALTLTGLSNSGLTTLDKTVTVGNTSFNGAAVFAPSTPAKVYLGTGTVTDVTSAIAATNAAGAIVALGVTPIAATNANVTYTNASTLYIAGAPSAGTNITITNPYALYVAAGDAYFGGTVTAGTVNLTTLDLTNLEVTNIKAKDGTASMTLADSTGVVTFSANPVLNAGTANGVPYLSSPGKVLTTGSALTFDGTNLVNTSSSVGTPEIAIANSATSAGANARLRIKTGGSGSTTYGDAFIQFTDSLNWNWSIGAGSSTSNNLTFNQYFGLTSNELMRLTSTGLGIGTNNPAYKLDVNGNVNIGSTSSVDTALFVKSSTVTGLVGAQSNYSAWSSGGLTTAMNIGTTTNNGISFGTNNIGRLNLDSSGNLGLGVTPSAWGAGIKALQIGTGASLINAGVSGDAYLGQNVFFNGTNNLYINTQLAGQYAIASGVHTWYNAPSGTANSASVTNTRSYTVVALGSSTLAQWQAFFNDSSNNPLTVTPTLGQVLTGNATGTLLGGGLVTQNISFTQAMTLSGTSAPALRVGVTADLAGFNFQGANQVGFSVHNSGSSATAAYFSAANNVTLTSAGNFAVINGVDGILFGASAAERARITSVGGFETRPAANGHAVFNEDGVDADFRVEGDTDTHLIFADASTDRVGIGTNNPLNFFQLGTFGAIDGNALQCYFRNNVYYDSIDARDESIKAGYSNVIVLDNNSGGILFQTTSTSAAGANVALSLVERARISSDGTFRVKGAGTAGSTDAFQVAGTAPADSARITSGGDLLVGTQTSGGKLTVEQGNANANGAFITNQTYNYQTLGLHNTATANDNILVAFGTEASYTTRGSIQYNRGAGLIAYLTTSDYRAKDISGPVVDSGALIDSVPVYMGKMKGATQERPMFIAHETPAYAHTGVKDAVDADGKPVYQQMDASALVPVMWAEIQSLRARVAQLEQGA